MLWLTLRQLRSPDEATRIKAVQELGKLPAKQAVDYLLPALSDNSFDVRIAVVRTLGKFNDNCVVQPLLLALNDRFASVRQAATEESGKFDSVVAVRRLIAALGDDDPGVRRAAVNILENLKSQEAIQALSDNQELVDEIHQQAATGQGTPQFANIESEVSTSDHLSFDSKLTAATSQTYVTYSIIGLNIAIFIITVLAGAGLVQSNAEVLLKWGADYAPLTTQGEWWRLLTSAFLHFGIIHIGFNMWVFYSVGPTVEKLYGNAFFLVIYLASAVFSSLLSIAINGDKVISAGASGAIFGVFGALLAYLVVQKKEVPETVLKSLMKRGLSLVGYNILFGLMRSGTDNAAHFGGVISGFLLGLILARPLNLDLRKLQGGKRLSIGTVSAVLSIVLICFALPKSAYSYKDEAAYREVTVAFARKEAVAINKLNDSMQNYQNSTFKATEMAQQLETDCLPVFREFNQRFAAVKLTDKSPSYKMRALLVDYTKARGDAIQCFIEGLRTGDSGKFQCYQSMESKAQQLVDEINALAAKK